VGTGPQQEAREGMNVIKKTALADRVSGFAAFSTVDTESTRLTPIRALLFKSPQRYAARLLTSAYPAIYFDERPVEPDAAAIPAFPFAAVFWKRKVKPINSKRGALGEPLPREVKVGADVQRQ
jgi:hypothetical protein